MAGKGVELLVSPTDDVGKLLSCLHGVKVKKKTNKKHKYAIPLPFFTQLFRSLYAQIGGHADVAGAVQVAQLALKHRRNKNGGQRVVVFVGSPLEADTKTLVKVGKQLKKNGIAIDVVSLGEVEDNKEKLQVRFSPFGSALKLLRFYFQIS